MQRQACSDIVIRCILGTCEGLARSAPASLKGERRVGLDTDRRCWSRDGPKEGARVGVPTSDASWDMSLLDSVRRQPAPHITGVDTADGLGASGSVRLGSCARFSRRGPGVGPLLQVAVTLLPPGDARDFIRA